MKKKPEERKPPSISYPDPKVFGNDVWGNKQGLTNALVPERSPLAPGVNHVFNHYDTLYPETGGMYRCYTLCKYAEKCFNYPQAIHSANQAKRYLLGHLRMASKSIWFTTGLMVSKRARNEFLRAYIEAADLTLRPHYLNGEYPRYYCNMAKQVGKFLESFLKAVGIAEENAFMFARIVMTIFENDEAYRYRVQDLAGVTTRKLMIEDMPREMRRIAEAFSLRDPGAGDGMTTGHLAKLNAVFFLLRVAWFVPRFRNAIRQGLQAMDWKFFVMDVADRYFNLLRADYNIEGRGLKERYQEFYEVIHEGNRETFPPMIEYWTEGDMIKTRIIRQA